MRIPEYICLLYGEGVGDKKFLLALTALPKFKYHTKKWEIFYDNARGAAPEEVLKSCRKAIFEREYTLILCFIDLDKLKEESKQKKLNWKKEQKKLEEEYLEIKIIWQIDNAEDEYKRVLGEHYRSKGRLNKLARENITKFINSDFWKRILKPIRDKEQECDDVNK